MVMSIRRVLIVTFISCAAISARSQHPLLTYKVGTPVVCVVPCADMIGEPVRGQSSKSYYESLPLSSVSKSMNRPLRTHQVVFNEMVKVVDQTRHEVCVTLSNLFYETADGARQSSFWVLKSAVMPLSYVRDHGVDISVFPLPLTMKKELVSRSSYVSLLKPWHDPVTNKTYSVGTRFVRSEKPELDAVGVLLFDPTHMRVVTSAVPKDAVMEGPEVSKDEQRMQFVKLVKSWAHMSGGFIPYVWGGMTVGTLCKQESFTLRDGEYERDDVDEYPKMGLDCSGLIARAAALVHLPYWYKNSFTIARHMPALKKGMRVKEGDIIWIPGHVMIVSDTKNSLLVEARDYGHGYGRVHEIPLSEEFKNMRTYHDLERAFFSNKPLQRLNKKGEVAAVIPTFKLLTFPA